MSKAETYRWKFTLIGVVDLCIAILMAYAVSCDFQDQSVLWSVGFIFFSILSAIGFAGEKAFLGRTEQEDYSEQTATKIKQEQKVPISEELPDSGDKKYSNLLMISFISFLITVISCIHCMFAKDPSVHTLLVAVVSFVICCFAFMIAIFFHRV